MEDKNVVADVLTTKREEMKNKYMLGFEPAETDLEKMLLETYDALYIHAFDDGVEAQKEIGTKQF